MKRPHIKLRISIILDSILKRTVGLKMDESNNSLSQSSETIFSFLSCFISAISFFYAYYNYIIDAYSNWILFCITLILILCLFLRKHSFFKFLSIYFLVFGFLTILTRHIVLINEKENMQGEILSDATMGLAGPYIDLIQFPQYRGWLPKAVDNKNLEFILISPSEDANTFVQHVYDSTKVIKDHPNEKSIQLPIISSKTTNAYGRLFSKYQLVVLFSPYLKENWDTSSCIILPKSTTTVLEGLNCIITKRWDSAREKFLEAEMEGNAAGSYYLAWMYEKGFGMSPETKEKKLSTYQKAADNGSREARYILGKQIIEDSLSSSLEKEIGEKYLRLAARVNTIASINTIEYSQKSTIALNSILRATGRNKEAYKLTRDSYNSFNNPYLNLVHLQNCISCRKYKEAFSIIKEGEENRDSHCFVVHARMLIRGIGCHKDYLEAQRLLQFAADSLDYSLAYRELSQLWKAARVDDDGFWETLYEINFSNNINHE